jgi:hypothetical protein
MSTVECKELSHPAGEVIKIAAGKTLDLKSQGEVVMPAGSVLQAVNIYSTNKITVTSTAVISLDSLSLIPIRSGSKFIINFFLQANWGGTYNGFGAYMFKDGVQIAESGNQHSVYFNTGTDIYMGGAWSTIDTGSTAGTPITFELRASAHNVNPVNFSNAGQSRGFVIMEIQG